MKRKSLFISFAVLTLLAIVIGFLVQKDGFLLKEEKVKLYNNKADEFLKQELYNEAITRYKESLMLKPSAYSYQQLSVAYYNLGDYKNAEISLEKAIDMIPASAKPNTNLIRSLSHIYAKEGKYDEVIVLCKKALESIPNSAELLNNLADAYMNKGMYNEAIVEIKKALAVNPNLAIAHSTYGEIYEKLGDNAKALGEFEKIKNDPKFREYAQKKILEISKLVKNKP